MLQCVVFVCVSVCVSVCVCVCVSVCVCVCGGVTDRCDKLATRGHPWVVAQAEPQARAQNAA